MAFETWRVEEDRRGEEVGLSFLGSLRKRLIESLFRYINLRPA